MNDLIRDAISEKHEEILTSFLNETLGKHSDFIKWSVDVCSDVEEDETSFFVVIENNLDNNRIKRNKRRLQVLMLIDNNSTISRERGEDFVETDELDFMSFCFLAYFVDYKEY